MKKQTDSEWRITQKSIMITCIFFWIALLTLSIYNLISKDELGPAFIIMNAGTIIFCSSTIILRGMAKKSIIKREE